MSYWSSRSELAGWLCSTRWFEDAEVEESADGVEVGDGLTTASLRNRFILYEPPHRTLVSPPHLEMHPSAAGSSLAVLPQKHCVPYSKPA